MGKLSSSPPRQTSFFSNFMPLMVDYKLRSAWVTEEGVGEEYQLFLTGPNGTRRHDMIVLVSKCRSCMGCNLSLIIVPGGCRRDSPFNDRLCRRPLAFG